MSESVLLEKIDNLLTITERIEAKVEKTNGRVAALEKWRSYLLGITSAILFLIGKDFLIK